MANKWFETVAVAQAWSKFKAGRELVSSRWTWRLLALPGVAWLSIFFIVAFYAVVAVAFGNQDSFSQPVPFWNPLDWNVGYVSTSCGTSGTAASTSPSSCARSLSSRSRWRSRSRSATRSPTSPPATHGRWRGIVLVRSCCRSGSTT